MKYFFRSWKESLSLFMPRNAKLFFLVTLKSIVESYKLIGAHLWWLFLASSILDLAYSYYFSSASYFCLIPFFGMYLIIRPSMKRKSFDYYKDYIFKFGYFVFFSIIAYIVSESLSVIGNHAASLIHIIHPLFYILFLPVLLIPVLITFLMPPEIIILYVSPLLTFLILFMLDSNGGIKNVLKSMIRAFKMIIYNYPFCIIMFAIFVSISLGSTLALICLFGRHSFLLSPIISNALLPIPLCILTNFYTKRLHDQFGLYFPETVKE